MKWLIACLAALFMVTSAMAGEDPYIAVVGNDILANGFYLSPKYEQFLYDQSLIGVPTTGEVFTHSHQLAQPEICDELGIAAGIPGNFGPPFSDAGNPNFRVDGSNQGWFEWVVSLPKKPNGEINLCIQCGILKPDSFHLWGYGAINNCAAETGERVESNCTREEVEAGQNPLILTALPKISAVASRGLNAPVAWADFNLTAFRNPGTYNPFVDSGTSGEPRVLANGAAGQLLNGTDNGTRILLKSCMDKCVIVKLPVTGQVNALGQTEFDLEAGDSIRVRLNIPRENTVDIYCNQESLKVMGIGVANF